MHKISGLLLGLKHEACVSLPVSFKKKKEKTQTPFTEIPGGKAGGEVLESGQLEFKTASSPTHRVLDEIFFFYFSKSDVFI